MLRELTRLQREELDPAEQRRVQLGGVVDVGMLDDEQVMKLWLEHGGNVLLPEDA